MVQLRTRISTRLGCLVSASTFAILTVVLHEGASIQQPHCCSTFAHWATAAGPCIKAEPVEGGCCRGSLPDIPQALRTTASAASLRCPSTSTLEAWVWPWLPMSLLTLCHLPSQVDSLKPQRGRRLPWSGQNSFLVTALGEATTGVGQRLLDVLLAVSATSGGLQPAGLRTEDLLICCVPAAACHRVHDNKCAGMGVDTINQDLHV